MQLCNLHCSKACCEKGSNLWSFYIVSESKFRHWIGLARKFWALNQPGQKIPYIFWALARPGLQNSIPLLWALARPVSTFATIDYLTLQVWILNWTYLTAYTSFCVLNSTLNNSLIEDKFVFCYIFSMMLLCSSFYRFWLLTVSQIIIIDNEHKL